MHNIKYIRSNPLQFEKMMSRRGISINSSEILDIDNSIRAFQTELQVLQEKRNKASKQIGKLVSEGSDISILTKNISDYKNDLSLIEEKIKELTLNLNKLLIELPNSLDDDVPDGTS